MDILQLPPSVPRHEPERKSAPAAAIPVNGLVTVVIPCYNHARFLGEAIESALRQSYAPVEVVVVDDGSSDNTAEVAARYPTVRCVRQVNSGLSAARNTGLQHSRGEYLVFLDADDLLWPDAAAIGRRWLDAYPRCAFAYGRYRLVSADGSVISEPFHPLRGSHYAQLLTGNPIGMHAAVMYRRSIFDRVGGFDSSLHAGEDYDMYLRVARDSPIVDHPHFVADYRWHGSNMSWDPAAMLPAILDVLRRQWPYVNSDPALRRAYRMGVRNWRRSYGRSMLERVNTTDDRAGKRRLPEKTAALVRAGGVPLLMTMAQQSRSATMLKRRLQQLRRFGSGRISFGDLRTVKPLSRCFGFDRGLPIDRHYIERFLLHRAEDIRGRVLEVGDSAYTKRFGGTRVRQADVLHVTAGNPEATFVADLADAPHLPSDAFDCVVLTQTLHLIYDFEAALRTIYRILKPGGVLLLTVPGISQTSDEEWRASWYWSFTVASLRRAFEQTFRDSVVRTEAHGNVLTCAAFLYGLAAEELDQRELEVHDPDYCTVITVRAVKSPSGR